MKNETQAVIDEHKIWGCKYTAIGGFFPKEPDAPPTGRTSPRLQRDRQEVRGPASRSATTTTATSWPTSTASPRCRSSSTSSTHRSGWRSTPTGSPHGGGDPIQWINKVKGRIPCVHLKDMAHHARPHAVHGRGRRGQPELARHPRRLPRDRRGVVHRRTGHLPARPVRERGDQLGEPEGDGAELSRGELQDHLKKIGHPPPHRHQQARAGDARQRDAVRRDDGHVLDADVGLRRSRRR